MIKLNNQNAKNPVCTILWQDAAYSYSKEFSKELPSLRLTTGFIIVANDEFINIAVNVEYNQETGVLRPIDGFLIPKGVIVEFKKIGFFNE
ncbi:MAG: hypothetical protein AAB405_01400 [Patescibacteria group bacterium]